MQSWVSVWFCSCSCFWPGSQWGAGLDATLIGPVTRVVAVTSATVRVVQCNWLKSYGGSGVYLLVYLHPIPLHKLCPIEVLFGCECSIWFLKLLKLESLVSKLGQEARGALYSSSPPDPNGNPHPFPARFHFGTHPHALRKLNSLAENLCNVASAKRKATRTIGGYMFGGQGISGTFGDCWCVYLDNVLGRSPISTELQQQLRLQLHVKLATGKWQLEASAGERLRNLCFVLPWRYMEHQFSLTFHARLGDGTWNGYGYGLSTPDFRFSILCGTTRPSREEMRRTIKQRVFRIQRHEWIFKLIESKSEWLGLHSKRIEYKYLHMYIVYIKYIQQNIICKVLFFDSYLQYLICLAQLIYGFFN